MTDDISQMNFTGGPLQFEFPITLGDVELLGMSWIGRYTNFQHGVLRSHCKIGRYCVIGRWVTIGAGDHILTGLSTGGAIGLRIAKLHQDLGDVGKKAKGTNFRVLIGHDVTIGDKATVMSGITINTGAVIAPNSVVTKDVPPYAIVEGIPAVVTGYRYDQPLIRKLLAFKWWQFTDEAIRRESVAQDPTTFINRLALDELERKYAKDAHSKIPFRAAVRDSEKVTLLERRISVIEKAALMSQT